MKDPKKMAKIVEKSIENGKRGFYGNQKVHKKEMVNIEKETKILLMKNQ